MSALPAPAAPSSTVAVIGAGIAGMHAALLLAEAGRRVALIERGPAIGGSLHLLERTYPSDSCGLCFLEPGPAPTLCPTFVCAGHPLITLHTLSSVARVEGTAGSFHLMLDQTPRYVREDVCDGCGLCEAACPVTGLAADEGLIESVKAIRRPPARAMPSARFIDPALCTRCGRCVEVCPRRAIDLQQQTQRVTLHAGAIIAVPGYRAFPAAHKGEYGYGILDNVVTSLEFERILNAAWNGSGNGRLLRPADGAPVKKIAFISCVGSRDPSAGRPYCSSVCCTITAKQATAAHQMDAEIESCVFYMDLRAAGEASGRYLDHRSRSSGIRYERCQVSTIKQRQQSRNLLISYGDASGRIGDEEFDLVVLAVGLGGPADAPTGLAHGLGIELDAYGLASTGQPWSLESSRSGIWAAGAFRGPKEIAETIVEAGAAAAAAAGNAPPVVGSEEPATSSPPWPDEPERLGVLLCGHAAAADGLVERVEKLAGVVMARPVPDLGDAQVQAALAAACTEARVNRLVLVGVGATRDAAFERAAARLLSTLGLPDASLARIDLPADQSAALHAIVMAVAGLSRRPATPRPVVPKSLTADEPRIVLIGGGPAGLAAAQTLAGLGCQVELLERADHLGGSAGESGTLADAGRLHEWLTQQTERLAHDPRISVRLSAAPWRIRRVAGDFAIDISQAQEESAIRADAVIVATGSQPATPRGYGYSDSPFVITQQELEIAHRADRRALAGCRSVVMILCAGARQEDHLFCNRTCCTQAVKNALWLKENYPDLSVSVLFREMQTTGMHELDYERARAAGVLFIRYQLPDRPLVRVEAGGLLTVQVLDPLLRRSLALRADRVVLSAGVEPAPAEGWMAELGVTLSADGFLQPAHEKMRPLHTKAAGVFACGAVLGPCFPEEAIVQGQGAAMAAALYARRAAQARPASASISSVNERLCSGCGLCVEICPFEARTLSDEDRIAHVIEDLCEGCGMCAMVCPNGATQQRLFETGSMLAMVDAAAG